MSGAKLWAKSLISRFLMRSFLKVNTNAKTEIFALNILYELLWKRCLVFTAQKMILSLTVAAFFDSVAYVMVR